MTDVDTGAADPAGCTAVLLSVPQQVAERIEAFLTANGVACRIRLNTEMTPERLAEEYLRRSPGASGVMDVPVLGPLLRGRLAEDLKAEIRVVSSEIPPVWDVLVRPEDLPASVERAGETPGTPRLNVPVPAPAAASEAPASDQVASDVPASPGAPVVLCELPWTEAWALSERLNAGGIPAAVMAAEEPDRDRPMQARIVPVGVRPEDRERAAAFLG